MKKIIIIALSGLVFSCNGIIGDGFEVSGVAKGIADGTNVFLEKQDAKTGLVTVDTVKVEGGKFTFEGEAKELEIRLIQIENLQGKVPFILESGNIDVIVNKDSIGKSKIAGTFQNDEFQLFNNMVLGYQSRMLKFQTDNNAKMMEAQQKKDTVVINSLRKDFAQITKDMDKRTDKYTEEHKTAFVSLLLVQEMFNKFPVDPKKIQSSFDKLSDELKNNTVGKEIKTKLESFSAVLPGKVAPDFSAPNVDGKMVSLKESLGKVTIIDFWASWCAPCRAENPAVVALYNEFHAKGLNIIGVSLDRAGEDAKWKEAIAKDGLTWTQVSNLKFWEDPIAMKYNVKSIPATFLLDASGKIVAKDLHGAELKAKVAELLAK